MIIIVGTQGEIHCLYGEELSLASLGALSIRRASHVEPDDQGQWWADLSPANGPKLGPYALRSAALDGERAWLEQSMIRARNDFDFQFTH